MKKSTRFRKVILYGLSIVLLLIIFSYLAFFYPFRGTPFNAKRHGNPPLTPPWALECWLWEDDYNTAEYVDSLLAGYAKHDIPVRTILLDSPWSLRYNDFETDTIRYPNPKQWFKKLQDNKYRVVLWMTSMVNSKSKDTRLAESTDWFEVAKSKGYLAGKGNQIKWWKGRGGFIDYTNPEAMKWWRGMQKEVFDYGIDGWKLDGTATLFHSKAGPIPLLYKSTHKGIMTTRQYMDHYYRDEYNYGLSQNPEFVTLSRSIDKWYHPEGFSPIDASPVNWVGDQKHTWESTGSSSADDIENKDIALKGIDGIEQAIKNILESAKLGYNIIGSDVAGFSGREIPPRLYIRWAQFSSFCGLFLNGGHGERALWKRTSEEFEIIRRFSWLHTELVPYMYSYVVTANKGGRVLQKPVKGKYHYLFGEDFLVAPIYRDNLSNKITIPKGKWRYLFNDTELITGPKTIEREFPLAEFPVFIREGAIVPMNIERNYTGFGDDSSKGYLTWLIYPGIDNAFRVFHTDVSGSSEISVQNKPGEIEINLKDSKKLTLLNIHLENKPKTLVFNNQFLNDSTDYQYNSVKKKLIVKMNKVVDGVLKIGI